MSLFKSGKIHLINERITNNHLSIRPRVQLSNGTKSNRTPEKNELLKHLQSRRSMRYSDFFCFKTLYSENLCFKTLSKTGHVVNQLQR
jgi:hypothetical protein